MRQKVLPRAAAVVAINAALVFALVHAPSSAAEPQEQKAVAATPAYEFDAASIKPTKAKGGSFAPGFTADGYRGSYVTLLTLIRSSSVSGGGCAGLAERGFLRCRSES
jgi:hypothetical protein